MSIWTRMRDALGFGPTRRNKPGGMAYIVGMKAGGGDVMNGRVVQTVKVFRSHGKEFWLIDPRQEYVATANLRWPHSGSTAQKGELIKIDGIADECLVPLQNPGDEEQDESAKWLPPVPAGRPEGVTA